MVPFAGWEMPVQYEGVIPEHLAVRGDAGAFDVSHMGQLHVDGPDRASVPAVDALERRRPARGRRGAVHAAHERAGRDRRRPDRLPHERPATTCSSSTPATERPPTRGSRSGSRAASEVRDASDEYALIAVQGPRSLERLGLPEAPAFTHAMGELDGIEVMVCRTGYTGEQGVELLCAAEDAVALWDAVARARGRRRAGSARATRCASRSATRCTGTTSPRRPTRSRPASAGRARSTRSSPAPTSCARIKEEGPERRLVAFVMEEKAIPRQGMAIEGGGEVTSGTHSPIARRRHRDGVRPDARSGSRVRGNRARRRRAVGEGAQSGASVVRRRSRSTLPTRRRHA